MICVVFSIYEMAIHLKFFQIKNRRIMYKGKCDEFQEYDICQKE